MCPICVANAALIVGSILSTGGLAAIIIRKLGVKDPVDQHPDSAPSKEEPYD